MIGFEINKRGGYQFAFFFVDENKSQVIISNDIYIH